MRCTVILVNFHCASETLAAIDSVLRDDPECSICVADNSVDVSERERLAQSLPVGTRLLVNERNIGFGAACNLALRECKTEYVMLLNPDARMLPGAQATLVDALEGDPALAAVAPATWWDDDRQWLLPTLLPETARQWFVTALAQRWPQRIGRHVAARWMSWQQRLHAGGRLQAVDYLSGAALLLRRSAVAAAGGLFDERFFMFYEDTDLSRRLRAAGFDLALVPQAQAIHHWRNRASKTELMVSSAAGYRAKHYPVLLLLARRFNLPEADPFAPLARSAKPSAGLGGHLLPTIDSCAHWTHWLAGARLVCLSPTPLGFPAIFRPAGAAPLAADRALWERLDPGRYTVLIESTSGREWLAFEKAPA